MIVLLDLGNSRIKAALFSANEQALQQPHHFDYHQLEVLDNWLTQLGQPVTHALGISVVATNQQKAVEQLLARHQCPVRWLDAQTETHDIYSLYNNQQLGPDRWFGLLGALYQFPPKAAQALVYCSFGTATTIDTLIPREVAEPVPAKPWVFLGGLILPGPYLMYQSLHQHTARLNLEPGALSDFPRHTRSAIRSGICRAQLGALWAQCLQAQNHCPEQPVLLACAGGGWPLIQEALEQDLERWHHLHQGPAPQLRYSAHTVLHGLAYYCAHPH